MPTYEFLCHACATLFSKILTVNEYEVGGVVCTNCGSDDVEQRLSSIHAVTSKKDRSQNRASREKVNLSAREEDDRARVLSDWEGEGGSSGAGKGGG
jgi:putative FmdB family regulatory protein